MTWDPLVLLVHKDLEEILEHLDQLVIQVPQVYKDQRVLQVILGKVDNQALQELLEILDHKVGFNLQNI